MNHLKPYESYLNESIWSGIDLQKEFDDINKKAFDGEVEPIQLKFVHQKGAGGRLYSTGTRTTMGGRKVGELRDETPHYIAISTYYDKTYAEFRDTLAHEMIHLWLMQKQIRDNGYHGFRFQDKMGEVNKRGFNVTLKDDVKETDVTDKTPLKKEVGVVVLDNKTEKKVLISVMDISQMTDDNIKDILDTVKYTSKVGKRDYQLSFRSSNFYRLGTYKITKKYKSAHKLKYYNMEDYMDEFMENSKLVDGWNITAGNLEHFAGKDI